MKIPEIFIILGANCKSIDAFYGKIRSAFVYENRMRAVKDSDARNDAHNQVGLDLDDICFAW